MACRPRWSVFLILTLSVHFVHSIYEDQLGSFNWFQENVGNVRHAVFHQQPSAKRVFVGTDSRVLAALNSRTGVVVWRQVLPTDDHIDKLVSFGKSIVTLSGAGKNLRLWNLADGALRWHENSYSSPPPKLPVSITSTWRKYLESERTRAKGAELGVDVIETGPQEESLVVLVNGTVSCRSADDGSLTWSWSQKSAAAVRAAKFSKLVLVGGVVYVVGQQDSKLAVAALDSKTGALKASGLKAAVCEVPLVSAAGWVACVERKAAKLHVFSLDNDDAQSLALASVLADGAGADDVRISMLGAMLTVHAPPSHATLLRLKKGGPPDVVEKFSGGVFAAADAVDRQGRHMVAMVSVQADGMVASLMPSDGSASAIKIELAGISLAEHGVARRLRLNCFSKKDGGAGHRLLVVTDDQTVHLVSGHDVAWTRHEALASIVELKMVDIPPPPPLVLGGFDGVNEGLIGAWQRRITSQVMELQAMIGKLGVAGFEIAGDERPADSLVGDRFGLRKMVIVLTASGKLFGVLSETGKIAWSRYYSGWDKGNGRVMLQQLYPLSSDAVSRVVECAVLAQQSTDTASTSFISTVDALSGKELSNVALPIAVKQALPLTLHDEQRRIALALLGSDDKFHLFPDRVDVHHRFRQLAPQLNMYLVEPPARMSGRSVSPSSLKQTKLVGASYDSIESWLINLPHNLEKIAAVSSTLASDPISSVARVMPDRGVLWKSLNPNTIAVATTTADGATATAVGVPGTKSRAEQAVRVYMIDSVTGAIQQTFVHRNAHGPLHLIQSENLVLLHYWNSKAKRYEVSVMELLEQAEMEWGSGFMLKILSGNVSTTHSSHRSAGAPMSVARQTFVFGTGLKAFGATTTSLGITQKQILMGLSTDQVLGMDRRLLDPRRPMRQVTAEEREDGLISYSPLLPIQGVGMITYNFSVTDLQAIRTAPAGLESSSLVAAWGLDLFYTRHAPSKAFDCLNDDFNYPLLILGMAGLAVATVVSSVLVKRKELHAAWA